jgi:endoglucanase
MKLSVESLDFLARLIETPSPSGYEDSAAALWEKEARTFTADVHRDAHGNTDAVIHPGGRPRIMLSGHYDEIGFLVTHIDDEGFVWFAPIGGWDPQIAQGQRVRIRARKGMVPGVIGKCPVHLMKEEARKQVTKIEEMWVDIGAKNRKAAEKLVEIGDPMVLDYGLQRLDGRVLAGRAFDNRAGAFIVLEAARRLAAGSPKAEIHAVATVQEEIGLRGARTAAFGVDPQFAIAVDVTFATDHPSMGDSVRQEGQVKLGGGAVVTRGPNIHPRLFDLVVETARQRKIKHQVIAAARPTGTDANVIQINRAGVATALVSLPNRYMHSPCELIDERDLEACIELVAETARRIGPDTDWRPF